MSVAKEFVSINRHQMNYFGKFYRVLSVYTLCVHCSCIPMYLLVYLNDDVITHCFGNCLSREWPSKHTVGVWSTISWILAKLWILIIMRGSIFVRQHKIVYVHLTPPTAKHFHTSLLCLMLTAGMHCSIQMQSTPLLAVVMQTYYSSDQTIPLTPHACQECHRVQCHTDVA